MLSSGNPLLRLVEQDGGAGSTPGPLFSASDRSRKSMPPLPLTNQAKGRTKQQAHLQIIWVAREQQHGTNCNNP